LIFAVLIRCIWILLVLVMPTKVRADSDTTQPTAQSAVNSTENPAHAALDEAYRCKGEHDLTCAKAAFERALQAGADAQVVWIELGYLASAVHDTVEAIGAFRRAVSGADQELSREAKRELDKLAASSPPSAAAAVADEASADFLLEQAYRLKAAGEYQRAAATFRAARRAGAGEQQVALELAYVALDAHDPARAKLELERARSGPSHAQELQAEKELAALESASEGGSSRHFWADLYAEAFGWSRIAGANQVSDLVPVLRLRGFYTPFATFDLSLYLFAQATRELAWPSSDPSGVPLIYADNTAIVGPGILYRLWARRIGIYAQLGPAFALVNDGGPRVQLDVRAGAYLGLESSDCWPAAQSGSAWGLAVCLELYSEVTYASRYHNDVIGFARGRSSLRFAITGPFAWQLAAELRVAKDVLGEYYNNFVDVGAGPRVSLLAPIHLYLMVGPHFGSYFGEHHLDPAPHPLSYLDLRLQLATYLEF
jgi:Sec-independent protein translocase protein TatA